MNCNAVVHKVTQQCSLPLAKISCTQNDGQTNLCCAATPLIHRACKYSVGYVNHIIVSQSGQIVSLNENPEKLLKPIPKDDMSDIISKNWNWNELRDEYRFGDNLPVRRSITR